jgi:hypothetical protein
MNSRIFTLLIVYFAVFQMSSQSYCLPSFSPAISYQVGFTQFDVTSADFNNDGFEDLATANYTNASISILLGNSLGTFTSITNFTANILTPRQIRSADFNGDGNSDLVATNSREHPFANNPNGNQFTILLGDGLGSFAPASNFTIANNSYGIAIEDFNLDGKKDLVISNDLDVKILMGLGNGSFATTPLSLNVPGHTSMMTPGDFNADNKPDLAIVSQTNVMTVILGDGSGSFPTSVLISHPNPTISLSNIVSDDLNKDGVLDLAVSSFGPNTGLITYIGTGTGSFVISYAISSYIFISDLLSSDVNNDGNTDVVAVTHQGGLYTYLNDGNGKFSNSAVFYASLANLGIEKGDFNNDGRPDFAAVNSYTDSYVSVFINKTDYPNLLVISSPSIICSGETATLSSSGAFTYTWNTGATTSAITPSLQNTTTFTIIGSGQTGCKDSLVFTQYVNPCTGFSEAMIDNSVRIYPNPVSDFLNVQINNQDKNAEIEIFDLMGRRVITSKLNDEISSTDLRNIQSGVYFVKVICGKSLTEFKLIKN